MTRRFQLRLLLGILCAWRAGLFAADSERGRPLIQRFTAQEYRAHYQVWSAVQGADGLMWFGSQGAVLEYDGATWRKYPVPSSFVRQTTFGPDGRLYVGGEDTFGWIERLADGGVAYRSLLEAVPAEAKPIGLPRRVVATDDAVFAATDRHVLRWQNRVMKVWSFSEKHRCVIDRIGNELFLIRGSEGIFRLEGDEFRLVANPPALAAPQFTFLLPPPAGSDAVALLAFGNEGLFLLAGDGSIRPWAHSAANEFKSLQLFSGRRLNDGRFAIGTITGGLFLIAADGSSHQRLRTTDGLTHDTIIGLGEDREGGLWAATQNGLNRIDLVTPATVFDQSNGIGDGILLDLLRHDGVLYATFNQSLLRLVPATTDAPAHWERDPRLPAEFAPQRICVHPRGLLVAGTSIVLLHGATAEPVLPLKGRLTSMVTSATDPQRVFLGYDAAVGTLIWRDGHWVDEGLIPGITGEPQTMREESDGTLWVATGTRGVFRVRRSSASARWQEATVKNYFESNGLPAGHGWIFVRPGPFGTDFSSELGNHRFDETSGRFVSEDRYGLEDHRGAKFIFEPLDPGAPGEWWSAIETKRPQPDVALARGTLDSARREIVFKPMTAGVRSLLGLSGAQISYGEPKDGVVWVKGMDTLVRLETNAAGPRPLTWRPLLRQVRGEGQVQSVPPHDPLRLRYSTEPITFAFAAALFGRSAAPEFQTRLRGFRETWSEFSPVAEAVFTNLSGGPFTFEVRARDADGHLSDVAAITFVIAPPWHRSGPALLGYGLLAAAAMFGLIRWRTAASERERQKLEVVVAERTTELKIAKEAADTANRAKSTFLASMSHELRTPLNGVIGYAQVLMKDRELSARNRERLRIVQTSGEHLLRMINEVLDFSKIEAGKMELGLTPFHLPQLGRDIAAALGSRAAEKNLAFEIELAPELPDLVVGDPIKLRQVLDNLLGNAIKFTAQGCIRFAARPTGGDREEICFSVTDTGVGLSARDRATLFRPFQQAADGRPPEPGTGLGLTISQRMVELMGSKLEVESTPGAGSVFSFTVRLPVLAADATADRNTNGTITGYRGARRKILVVDDVATNRELLRDLLAPLGFEIALADSGVEALARAAAVTFDLAILDLRMPGIDGLELARRLRERSGARLKLIAMSASVLSCSREDAFAAGCDDFMPKPFREDDLLARIGLALQIEWTGESAASGNPPIPLDPLVTMLAPEIVAELLAIAQRGEIAGLRRRAGELRGDPLADAIDALARNFRMEHIRELLERHARQTRVSP